LGSSEENKKTLGVSYVNDIHLDFHCEFVKNQIKYEKRLREFANKLVQTSKELGEVLIISGDFGHSNIASYIFLDEISKYFNKVFITYGNHDLYLISKTQKNKYRNSANRVKELYDKTKDLDKVHFLGADFDGVGNYKGFNFGGDILMSTPKSEEEKSFYNLVMNDSKYIYLGGYGHENTQELNRKGLEYYESLKGKVDVFISHYPIITTDSHLYHGSESLGSYRTDVEELYFKYNFFGHVHEISEYDILGSKFYTHALGYPSEGMDLKLGYVEINK